MVASEVANRRFFNNVSELRVGVDNATYSYIGESSGLGPVAWTPNDPWKLLAIPAGNAPIYQLIGNFHILGELHVRDYEAVTQLFKTIDVVSGGGTETAMSSTDRNTCGYFALVAKHTKIVNATNARTDETSTFVFANTRIRYDAWNFLNAGAPVAVYWYADSVTQTDT